MIPDLSMIDFGSVASWVTASGVLGMFGLLLSFIPKWVQVKAAQRVSDHKIAKELRDELLDKLEACELKHDELLKENKELEERVALLEDGDRRKTIAITLLMNEVHRLDPSSDIILRAKGVLELSSTFVTPFDKKTRETLRKLEDEE